MRSREREKSLKGLHEEKGHHMVVAVSSAGD
jgi:hypothetical protein